FPAPGGAAGGEALRAWLLHRGARPLPRRELASASSLLGLDRAHPTHGPGAAEAPVRHDHAQDRGDPYEARGGRRPPGPRTGIAKPHAPGAHWRHWRTSGAATRKGDR